MSNKTSFLTSFLETLIWVGIDGEDEISSEFNSNDIAPESLATLEADCVKFFETNEALILADDSPLAEYWDGATDDNRRAAMAGHDFALNRNGHGAGFWDGDWPEPAASALESQATLFGECNLYLGDDGQLYTI